MIMAERVLCALRFSVSTSLSLSTIFQLDIVSVVIFSCGFLIFQIMKPSSVRLATFSVTFRINVICKSRYHSSPVGGESEKVPDTSLIGLATSSWTSSSTLSS